MLTRDEMRADIERAVQAALDSRMTNLQRLEEIALAMDGVLTARMVAKKLGVSARTVLDSYVPQGLRVYRIGKAPLFLAEDVVEFVKAHPE